MATFTLSVRYICLSILYFIMFALTDPLFDINIHNVNKGKSSQH